MKKLWIVIVVIVALLGIALATNFRPDNRPSVSTKATSTPVPIATLPTDFTARFGIFTQGTFRVFTSAMYHNKDENIFIEASNPNVIKVKKAGSTWDDFFKTLPFSLKKDCLTTGTKQTFCNNQKERLGFYINGEEVPDALGKVISPGDTLLVSFSNQNTQQIEDEFEKIPPFN